MKTYVEQEYLISTISGTKVVEGIKIIKLLDSAGFVSENMVTEFVSQYLEIPRTVSKELYKKAHKDK